MGLAKPVIMVISWRGGQLTVSSKISLFSVFLKYLSSAFPLHRDLELKLTRQEFVSHETGFQLYR